MSGIPSDRAVKEYVGSWGEWMDSVGLSWDDIDAMKNENSRPIRKTMSSECPYCGYTGNDFRFNLMIVCPKCKRRWRPR